MLRALTRFLDTGVPVIGANFGRVGFLTAIPGDELESGHGARLRGRVRGACRCRRSRSRPTASTTPPSTTRSSSAARPAGSIEIQYSARRRGSRHAAVRRAALRDAARARPPTTSRTAARCSSGASTRRCSRSSRRTRSMRGRSSSGPGFELEVVNRSPDVEAVVLADGHAGRLARDAARSVTVRFGTSRTHARHAARADVLPPLRAGLRHRLRRRAERPRSRAARPRSRDLWTRFSESSRRCHRR